MADASTFHSPTERSARGHRAEAGGSSRHRRARLDAARGLYTPVIPPSTQEPLPISPRNQVSGRKAALDCYLAVVPAAAREAVRDAVTACILHVPYISPTSDKNMASHLYQFATWNFERKAGLGLPGSFDPANDLSDSLMTAYREELRGRGMSDRSLATRLSVIRRIRNAAFGITPWRGKATRASAPYTDGEWKNLTFSVGTVPDVRLRREMQTLLALVGGAGLRPWEASRVMACDVTSHRGYVTVTAADRRGEVRVLPVIGSPARTLEAAARAEGYLLRPRLERRGQVLANISDSHARQGRTALAHFDPWRARHRWVVSLLVRPIPAADVLYLAGINPGSALISDLRRYLPTPSDDQMIQRLLTREGVQ